MVWNVVSDFFWGYGIDPIGVLLFTVFCIYMARPLIKDFKGMPVIPIVPKLGFRTRKARQVLLSLITLLFIVLIILFPWADTYRQLGTYDWEEVPATVEFSAVLEYTTCDEGGCYEREYPKIRYSYSVDGLSYSNDDIVLDKDWTASDGFGFSTSLVDEYPYGSETTAYYNSEDPNQAVLIKGFSGVLPVIIMLLGIMSLAFAAIVIFLTVWKILFHIQPKQNRQKAEKQYEDDIDDEREEREQRLKLRIARKTESFQGQSKTLSVQIDGEKGVIEVRTVMDIFESQLFDFRSVGILYLDNSHKMGRNLEFRYTSDEGDELEIREFLGEELIREQLINMDYHPSDAIDFISDALKSATPDTDEWWN